MEVENFAETFTDKEISVAKREKGAKLMGRQQSCWKVKQPIYIIIKEIHPKKIKIFSK